MIHVIRTDNEDNGVTCCKTLVDLIRNYRGKSAQNMTDFFAVFQESCCNMPELVTEVFFPPLQLQLIQMSSCPSCVVSKDSLRWDRSSVPSFEVIALESPAQRAAKVETMGGFWSGMAPDIQNPTAYADFLSAQAKILSYLTHVTCWSVDNQESYGDTLLLVTLRFLQDCPSNAIATRKELIVVFRHLLSTAYRRVIIPQLASFLMNAYFWGLVLRDEECFDFYQPRRYDRVQRQRASDDDPGIYPAHLPG
ncbi:hypothetical protein DFH06DRAFT_1152845 [Mycena polygramma]|nr:hypothetical protein DFH06DRAFT_1152845 [Mycena polygramma]